MLKVINLQDIYLNKLKKRYLRDKKVTTSINNNSPRTIYLVNCMRNRYIYKDSLNKSYNKSVPIFLSKVEINKRIRWYNDQSFSKEDFRKILEYTLLKAYKHHEDVRCLHLLIESNRVPSVEKVLDENEVKLKAREIRDSIRKRVPKEKLTQHDKMSELFQLGSNKNVVKKRAINYYSGKGSIANTFNPELNYMQLRRTLAKYLAEMEKFINFFDDFGRLTNNSGYSSMASALKDSIIPIKSIGNKAITTSEKGSYSYFESFIYLLHLLYLSEGLSVGEADIKVADTLPMLDLPPKSESTIYRLRTKGEEFVATLALENKSLKNLLIKLEHPA